MLTLADHKAQRETLLAAKAKRAYEEAAAKVVERTTAVTAAMAVRELALKVIDELIDAWLIDIAGEGDETRVHHAMSRTAHELLSRLAPRVLAAAPGLPRLAERFNAGATPRALLTVSQWAAKHRHLDTGTNSPGDWNNDLTPYLVEIMDCLSEHSSVRDVTFIKSSGVGGTEVLYNWIGYVMHHLQNKDMLVVVPTLELRDRAFNPRLAKTLDETEVLKALVPTGKRDRANRVDLLEYGARARIIKAGANSPDSLRSDHLPYVICDEVDAFPWDVGGEGDPMTLIENRQRTFSRRRSYFVSTPTKEDASRISVLFSRSDRRRYHVACPDCGEFQHLEFSAWPQEKAYGLKWRIDSATEDSKDGKQVIAAWYVCKHCGSEIQEKHKPAMLAGGRWIAERPHIKLHRGYHINALYAPTGLGLNWLDVAEKWVKSQGDTAELKGFVNTYLGEVYAEPGDSIEPSGLMARLEEYSAGLKFALRTAGVDVQKDRLEFTVVGWGDKEQGWALRHVIVPGDTTKPEVWDELLEDLKDARVDIACIDAGYNTTMVKDFCAKHRWCIATKGIPGAGRPLIEDEKKRKQRLRTRRKKGQPVEPLGVDQGKAILYARLKLETPGPGYIHFPQSPDFDEEYFAQLAAEKLITKMRGMRPFSEWVPQRPRNEALDCMVLNLAAKRMAELVLKRVSLGLPASGREPDAPDSAPSPATGPTGKISLAGGRFARSS